ncbi:unnamed protein product [Urochloa humidicola]
MDRRAPQTSLLQLLRTLICCKDREIQELLHGLGPPFDKPHQLVRQGDDDVLVAIASVDELNAAAPPESININGVLRGYVLPTVSYRDCLLLKAAAEEGLYRHGGGATKFSLADHTVSRTLRSALVHPWTRPGPCWAMSSPASAPSQSQAAAAALTGTPALRFTRSRASGGRSSRKASSPPLLTSRPSVNV